MRLGSPGEELDSLTLPQPADQACDNSKITRIGKQGCCSINDAADARLVAAELGIPLYVCNFKKDFGRIIDYFVDEYAQGRTPNPCVRCNDWLKFGKLHDYAKQIGATHVASGHYARIDHNHRDGAATSAGCRPLEGPELRALRRAPRAPLRDALPDRGICKPASASWRRNWACPPSTSRTRRRSASCPTTTTPRSSSGSVPSWRGGRDQDEAGNVVGAHKGQHHFTIGQRRGTGVALGYPIYVVDKDPSTNTVTVAPEEKLLSTHAIVNEANWLVDPPADEWFEVLARYRYNGSAVPAQARVRGTGFQPVDSPGTTGDSTSRPPTTGRMPVPRTAAQETPSGRTGVFEVRFDSAQRAVAPGQAMVLYDAGEPDVVLGGWVDRECGLTVEFSL